MTDTDILQRIQADMTAAMTRKPKDAGLSSDEAIEVVQRYAKKRRESIDEFRRLGREDLVANEEREIQVAARYLPQALSEDELRALVRAAVAKSGAAGPRDAGKVIGLVMAEARGRAEGGAVSRLVREILAG
jgi:uncharacterized protein